MSVKVGLYISTAFPADDPMDARFRDLLAQVDLANKNGFQSLWAGQHFLTKPLQMFQPIPLLARLLTVAEGMLLGPNILVMPLLNPAQVAEESVTMDWLSGGKYVVGVGLGYRDEEFETFGTHRKERVGRMVEAIEVMRRLWTEDTVDHRGKYYTIPNIGLGMKSVQEGGPPIWIAASSDNAIKRVARIGDAWSITFYPSRALLGEQLKLYRDELAEVGKPEPDDMPVLKECYVGTNNANAYKECAGPLKVKYDAYASWGQDKFLPDSEKFSQPFEEFVKDRFIIGDAAKVRDEIQQYQEEHGLNHFIMRMHWPGLEPEKTLRSIELMGSDVIPHV